MSLNLNRRVFKSSHCVKDQLTKGIGVSTHFVVMQSTAAAFSFEGNIFQLEWKIDKKKKNLNPHCSKPWVAR